MALRHVWPLRHHGSIEPDMRIVRAAVVLLISAATIVVNSSAWGRQPAARDSLRSIPIPAERSGWDGVLGGLLAAFDRGDVVILGEAHGRKVDAELRLRLVRHPQFPKKVRFIMAEAVYESQQPALDRYIGATRFLISRCGRCAWVSSPGSCLPRFARSTARYRPPSVFACWRAVLMMYRGATPTHQRRIYGSLIRSR